MKSGAKTLEDRIRERAYHIWEDSGRPSGRDEEFWQRACELIGSDDNNRSAGVKRRQPKQARPAQPPRKRSRKTSPPDVSTAGWTNSQMKELT